MKQKKNRIYQGSEASKKEREWIDWYEKGSDYWWNAYYEYEGRRRVVRASRFGSETEKSWFNSVLKSLKKKGMFDYVPFVFDDSIIKWVHPGFKNQGFVAETQEVNMLELAAFRNPVI